MILGIFFSVSDYTIVHDAVPEIPKRGYEGKGKLYTVPEAESCAAPQPDIGQHSNR